jgi:hypothetical protein
MQGLPMCRGEHARHVRGQRLRGHWSRPPSLAGIPCRHREVVSPISTTLHPSLREQRQCNVPRAGQTMQSLPITHGSTGRIGV